MDSQVCIQQVQVGTGGGGTAISQNRLAARGCSVLSRKGKWSIDCESRDASPRKSPVYGALNH